MESAKHQLQEQLSESYSLETPSFFGVGSNNHTWSPNLILNASSFNPNVNFLSNARHNNGILVSPLDASMNQDLGFHWASSAGNLTNELQLGKIKEEISDSCPKFTEMINSPSHVEEFHLPSTSYIRHEQQGHLYNLSEKLFLKTFSSGCQINEPLQLSSGDVYSDARSCASFGGVSAPNRGNFCQIYPSTHISNPDPSSSSFSCSLDMNLQALDLMTSTKFGGSFSQPSHNNVGLFKESISFGLDHLQESSPQPSNSSNKIPSFTSGVAETKRHSKLSEPKTSHGATKKPRLDSRSSSFPPFKVRKEKLGDRIATLQQLVAPFGKTDTASVLMEAIGYIKFLQDQVETLSVPYMKSSQNSHRQMQGGSSDEYNNNEEGKRDLRSRGLCLVPLSCTSYVTNDSGGVWPLPI